ELRNEHAVDVGHGRLVDRVDQRDLTEHAVEKRLEHADVRVAHVDGPRGVLRQLFVIDVVVQLVVENDSHPQRQRLDERRRKVRLDDDGRRAAGQRGRGGNEGRAAAGGPKTRLANHATRFYSWPIVAWRFHVTIETAVAKAVLSFRTVAGRQNSHPTGGRASGRGGTPMRRCDARRGGRSAFLEYCRHHHFR